MTITKKDVYKRAINIVQRVGVVKDGDHFYEYTDGRDGGSRYALDTVRRAGSAEAAGICGVCIIGAIRLAEYELGVTEQISLGDDLDDTLLRVARQWGSSEVVFDEAINDMITIHGKPYVVDVLEGLAHDAVAA